MCCGGGGAARKDYFFEVLTAERGLAIYDKAFIAYNDARQHLRDEIASAATSEGGSESAGRLGELKLADRALAAIVLEKTIERNKFLVSTAAAKLSGEVKLEKGEKAPRSEDLVHLYNTLLRNYEELAESGPEVMREMEGALEVEESIRVDCMLEQGLLHAARCCPRFCASWGWKPSGGCSPIRAGSGTR